VEEDKGRISPQVYQKAFEEPPATRTVVQQPGRPQPPAQSAVIQESPFGDEQPAARVQRKKKVEGTLDKVDSWLESNLW
jgi:hypothetical protein